MQSGKALQDKWLAGGRGYTQHHKPVLPPRIAANGALPALPSFLQDSRIEDLQTSVAGLHEEAANAATEAEASAARIAQLSGQLGERAAELEAATSRLADLTSQVRTCCFGILAVGSSRPGACLLQRRLKGPCAQPAQLLAAPHPAASSSRCLLVPLQVATVTAERAAREAELQRAAGQAAHLEAAVADAQQQAATSAEALAVSSAQAEALQQQVSEQAEQASGLERELAAAATVTAGVAAELADAQHRAGTAAAELADTQAQLISAREGGVQLEAQLAELAAQLQATEAAAASKQAEWQATEGQLLAAAEAAEAASQERLAELEAGAAAAEEQLAAARHAAREAQAGTQHIIQEHLATLRAVQAEASSCCYCCHLPLADMSCLAFLYLAGQSSSLTTLPAPPTPLYSACRCLR